MSGFSPFQILELNLISAQDLAKVSRNMRTYAVAWVHPERKLTTRVDPSGGTDPTWNDKFVFRVENQFLQSDTSAIMIEIYAVHWFRDVHVGTVRVLVGNLIPPQTRSYNKNHIGMRFVALQVRRPSGRPQGILNAGITVLDRTMRSMPLYTELSTSALGYQKLMGQDELHGHHHHGNSTDIGSSLIRFRRTKSERSSTIGAKDEFAFFSKPNKSTINASDVGAIKKGNDNKVVYDKPLSIVDGGSAPSDLTLALKLKAQEGKADSVLSYSSTRRPSKQPNKKSPTTKSLSQTSHSDIGVTPSLKQKGDRKVGSDVGGMKALQHNDSKQPTSKPKHNWLPPKNQPNKTGGANGYPAAKDFAAGSVWSESEVGPSPSEVAAAIAEDSKYRQIDDGRSSMLDDKWSMNESEGVRTKLERWRMNMHPIYDYGPTADSSSSTMFATKGKHRRRHTDGGNPGKFSCFGNICGYECSIVCGGDGGSNNKKRISNKRAARAPSIDSVSTYF